MGINFRLQSIAQKISEHDDDNLATPDYRQWQLSAPVQIFDVDLGTSVASLRPPLRPDGTRCVQGLALVRLHGRPVGVLQLDLSKGPVDPATFAGLVSEKLGDEIAAAQPRDPLPAAYLPLFSVVVPTRDRADSLARCLESLINLDYPDFEILVVDNSPTDTATAEVFNRFSTRFPRLRYVLEEKPGLSRARNRGLAEAKAPFVAFADDDVVVDRRWLRGLAEGFETAEDVACVTGLVMPAELETPAQLWFEQYGGFSKGFRRRIFHLEATAQDDRMHPYNPAAFGTGANMAFRTAVVRRLGGFDEALGAGTPALGAEDLDSFLRVLLAGHKTVYEPTALVWHFHRRAYPELETHIRGYGVGLGAFMTKLMLGRSTRLSVSRRLPYAAGVLLWPTSAKNSKKSPDFPKRLSLVELAGIARGPLAYFRSRRTAGTFRRQRPATGRAAAEVPPAAEEMADGL